MRMRAVKRYSVVEAKRENQLSILARDGKALDLELEGSVIEAQFELEDGCVLIWLTDDSPYDEGLHVYLVDECDTISDALEAGADFTPGILKTAKTGKDWIEFEFFSNDSIYRMAITKEARPRVLLPPGWKYKRLFCLHRLVVYELGKGID